MGNRILIAGVAVAALVAIVALVRTSGDRDAPDDSSAEVGKAYRIKAHEPSGGASKKDLKRLAMRKRRDRQEVKVDEKPAKPVIDFDTEEEAKLNELEREVIAELRRALDSDDRKAILRAISRILAMGVTAEGGKGSDSGRAAAFLRRQAIDALGWCGADGLADLAALMADPDPDIAQSALERFEQSMSDFTLSDRERADILVQMSSAIDDQQALDWMFMELCNMRNSVKADAVSRILSTGNASAKTLMGEQVEFYIESDVKTPEQIKEWLADNPDDEFDEEWYGGVKN